ncbi:MAG: RNA helicase [Clostridia bacterium]|nr:RNA helicase [Clostridia bacterium]
MKIVKLKLDYLSNPICGEYYNIEKHCIITKIAVIDEDNVLQDIGNEMQFLYSSYYEFDSHNEACWFNKEQQIKDKPKMLELLAKLKARLDEINDGSFEVEDWITPEYENL